MASRSSPRVLVLSLLTTVLPLSDALRVTPGSPCASTCSDSFDLSPTDPKFLDNQWKDVVCQDGDYDNAPKGQKMESCMSCLQKSTFTNGTENDQEWFMYNMRYTFDYCVFGYPNATGFNSGPCMTSEACGPLTPYLEKGIPDPAKASQYAYCDAGGGSNLGGAYEKCMSCMQADGSHSYLSNFLVALNVACQQKPAPDSVIPLNATIFSKAIIKAANPADNISGGGSGLSAAAVAGIAVAAIVLLALAIGCVFMQMQKRKNRGRSRHARNRSSLSFRCQTDVMPSGPAYYNEDYDDDRFFEKPTSATGIAVTTSDAQDEYAICDPHHNRSTEFSAPATAVKPSIVTTTLPPPSPAHTSPRRFSPDEYMTPPSAISLHSGVPLLNNIGAAMSPQSPSMPSPAFRDHSPRVYQSAWPNEPSQPENLWQDDKSGSPIRELVKKKSCSGRDGGIGIGSPIHAQTLQTSFPPPPKR
ncbi:hypothetical protein PT974_06760 [Cladobotryum mycophilum]|uniref:LPXTG-domain-containing protein n=1 Tax=Cladobotryum mycophilum TaxID=491253 RepID=A0ABR0SNG8_9HYPO